MFILLRRGSEVHVIFVVPIIKHARHMSTLACIRTVFPYRKRKDLHDAVRTYTRMIFTTPLGFLFVRRSIEKSNKRKVWTFDLLLGRNQNFNRVCVCWYSCHSVVIAIVVWAKQKFWDIFVVFSNKIPCRKETKLAVASIMTCKIGLIWRYMKSSVVWGRWWCYPEEDKPTKFL